MSTERNKVLGDQRIEDLSKDIREAGRQLPRNWLQWRNGCILS